MNHDVYVVMSASSSLGVLDLPTRKRDNYEVIHSATSWPRRSELLDKYGIEYFLFYEENPPPKWTTGRLKQVGKPMRVGAGYFLVMRLRKS